MAYVGALLLMNMSEEVCVIVIIYLQLLHVHMYILTNVHVAGCILGSGLSV